MTDRPPASGEPTGVDNWRQVRDGVSFSQQKASGGPSTAPFVRLRDAITAHIESEAKRTGTYHGDPAATPGGTGYCIPGAVATQIVDKHLLDYFAEARATPPALDALLALLDFDPCHECDNAQKVYDAIARLSASGESPDD